MADVDWSKLPYELLGDILLKLETIEDYFNFSSVCHSWNHSFYIVKSRWRAKVPYMLLGDHANDPLGSPWKIFSITHNKYYHVDVPELHRARCWGTSYGWFVVFSRDLQLYLFNPLTKAKMNLPPIILTEKQKKRSEPYIRMCYIGKAIVLKDEVRDIFIVFITCGDGVLNHPLYLARPGDRRWTVVNSLPCYGTCSPWYESNTIIDVVSMDRQFYFLSYNEGVGYCDASDLEKAGKSGCLVLKNLLCPPKDSMKPSMVYHECHTKYLVRCGDSILMVLREKFRGDYTHIETLDMFIYRLDLENNQWKELQSLCNWALFLGNDCSMAIDVSSARNFKPGTIYFTDEHFEYLLDPKDYGPRDTGCFDNVKQEIWTFEEIVNTNIHSDLLPGYWFIPQF